MGLDQYLHAKKYLSDSPLWGEEDKTAFHDIVKLMKVESFIDNDYPSLYVEVKVAQWRKSNQIHSWFVENAQNGDDDCRDYYVSRETIEELVSLCHRVLDDKSLAEELLPTRSGFFFGNTEYDDWYFNDVLYTAETLSKLLATVPESFDFYYSSSW